MLWVFPWSGTLPPGTCPYVCDDNLPCSIGLWDDLKGACCFCEIGLCCKDPDPWLTLFWNFAVEEMGGAMILIIGGPLCAGAATYTWSVYGHSLSLSKAVGFGWSFSALFVVFWARLLSDLRAWVVKQINPYWHFSSQDVVCKAMRAMLLVVVLSWA